MTTNDPKSLADESHLSPLQREWLEESRKIGPGTMTPTERKKLEEIYTRMLPTEQKELYEFIEKHYQVEIDETPIKEMEQREWSEPSDKLKEAFSKSQVTKPPRTDEES